MRSRLTSDFDGVSLELRLIGGDLTHVLPSVLRGHLHVIIRYYLYVGGDLTHILPCVLRGHLHLKIRYYSEAEI